MINKNEAFELVTFLSATEKTHKIISHITEKSTDQKKQEHREMYKKYRNENDTNLVKWEIDNHTIVHHAKMIALQMYDEKTTQWNWILLIPRDSIKIELTFKEIEILQEILDEQLQNLPLLNDQENRIKQIEKILGKLS